MKKLKKMPDPLNEKDLKKVTKDYQAKAAKYSRELADYLSENDLDPEKDWVNDPKHGEHIRALMKKIRLLDMKTKAVHTDKAVAGDIERKRTKLKKPNVAVKVREARITSYDYPDVDGIAMTREMKKKYRTKMRRLLKANMDVEKASQIALKFTVDRMDDVLEKEDKKLKHNKFVKDLPKEPKAVKHKKKSKKIKEKESSSKKNIKLREED